MYRSFTIHKMKTAMSISSLGKSASIPSRSGVQSPASQSAVPMAVRQHLMHGGSNCINTDGRITSQGSIWRTLCQALPDKAKDAAEAAALAEAARAALTDSIAARTFGRELMGPQWTNRARLSDDMLETLMELPGTQGMVDLRSRADSLATWKLALQRGTLPRLGELDWPQDPFKTKFADALQNLEMPRFTRRYPAILNTLMKQMLELVKDFEEQLAKAEEEAKQREQQQQSMMSQSQQQPQSQQQSQQSQNSGGSQGQEGAPGQGEGENEQQQCQQPQEQQEEQEMSQEMMEQAIQNALDGKQGQQQQQQKQLNVTLQNMQGDQQTKEITDPQLSQKLEKIADDIVKNFQQQMTQVMDNLEAGELAFDDLNSLLDGREGFDLSKGTWRRSGWRELDQLRKTLENCQELRDLVKQLGRSGGKGPRRKAPEEVEARGFPPGVIRSPLQPEEVRGLTRSGELSRMLPSEMALLAHGWPRKKRSPSPDGDGAQTATATATATATEQQADSGSSGEYDLQEYYLPGAHAARMLHRARRAERMLLSYERTGWLEDQPARLTNRMEYRPAAELGPIILCLDTSGSMQGARETVAKALALECLRGAHRQRRACYLYAFSGPSQVQELELKVDLKSLDKLLEFLSGSFNGGTDVDRPLELSLQRLAQKEWQQADILMVTDGEIPNPSEPILNTIKQMNEEKGLEVHGLLVSSRVTEPMKKLCTQLHVFKSWTAVGGKDYMY